ncbi:SdrD B-like domain-containing protein [Nitrosopumilus ureiphilus]|uniref:SdrD B-like domain-containing protein n=1 Tax=Nitrosopumilus ureiphilus TaxID=1470067 RepID=UPI0015C8B153|nr:SdrD B-like domain-containing protein [Nitrosopumilus ureiphilus]
MILSIGITSIPAFATHPGNPTLTIIKQSLGGDGTFQIQNTNSSGTSLHILNTQFGFASTTPIDIVAGDLQTVTEVSPNGFTLTGQFCEINGTPIPGNSTSFTSSIGDHVLCKFTNEKQNTTLTIIKQSLGGDGTFQIQNTNSSGTQNHFVTTSNGVSQFPQIFDITPGDEQSLSEIVPFGWLLTGQFCSVNGVDIPLNATTFTPLLGDSVLCKFTNVNQFAPAKITIIKNSGDFSDTFDFTIQNSTTIIPASITTTEINSENTGSAGPFFLTPDTYSVSETVPANWNLDNSECKNHGIPITPLSNLILNPADDVLCIFNNTRTDATGEIHGMKLQDGNPLSGVTINMTNNDNTINRETTTDSNGEYWFMDLIPDTYTVSEVLPDFSIQVFPLDNQPHIVPLSLGQIITGIDFQNEFVGPSEIHGTVWEDVDGDEFVDAGEQRFAGKSIILWKLTPPDLQGSFAGFITTNPSGEYGFTDLDSGFYRIQKPSVFGFSLSTPAGNQDQFVELTGNVVNDVNFGFQSVPPGTITGIKFNDLDGNGVQDTGEPGVSSVQICSTPGNTCTFTNFNGNYQLNLPPADYTVYEPFSQPFVTLNLLATTPSQTVTVISNQVTSGVNFGNIVADSPPPEVEIVNERSFTVNGLPTVYYGEDTTYRKNVGPNGFDHCGTDKPVQINLVISFPQSGTTFEQLMTEVDVTNEIWETTFTPFFPAHGIANLKFYVDCPADTLGFPEDISLISGEDEIQFGGSIYVDPSGTVFNQCTDNPVDGATVTLKVNSPPTTDNFVSSESGFLPDINPQITEQDGRYGWVVVPGNYKVTVAKSGFITQDSSTVTIPPAVTDLDIFLTPVDGCVIPLQEQKEGIITELQSELPTGDKKSDKELEKAISHITKSIDDKFWVDDSTLDSKDGHKVFDEEKNAVKSLLKVDAIDVSDTIVQIITIDEQLATDAFDLANTPENQADKKTNKELTKAESELIKGDKKANEGKFDKAIDHYKKSWKHSQKVLNSEQDDDEDD